MRTILPAMLLCFILFTACQNKRKSHCNEQKPTAGCAQLRSSFTNKIAEGYFVKNTVREGELTLIIKSQEDLESYFGYAAIQGKTPTKIDFSKEQVMAVICAASDMETTAELLCLEKKEGSITLHYKIKTGEKQSFTSRHSLVVIVDKSLSSPPQFNKEP